MSREARELRAVYADHGQNPYDEGLVQPALSPLLGNTYHIQSPVHLVKIAAGLSCFAELRAVDVFGREPAVG